MTKNQAKQFARIWIGQLLWEVKFDRNSVDCAPIEKDMIEQAINEQFFKLLGFKGLMSPQELYDLLNTEE